ncbi:hypothetical protein [Bacillus sp. MRMR6]|uniref:hypothetical protein n=1 Tax=Bacillus sp. MRMR6 TaxID=1928617 RepID=UPI0009524750|nr:hypothetical protein [Bacillus sp. MRMR6]OLS34337.1 hypothetical protein BTR25_22170 [Bacillus sp. MRMR6]
MKRRKIPKYKVGDTVVITMYGTVGKITDVKWLDGNFVYEVNKSDGLFVESGLQLLSEFEGKLIEQEQIDIEYKYFFGDLVQVKGYGSDLFKVVGFRTEIWRYKEDAWEDVIYELSRISDGEWLEAGEEELTLVADAESADTFIQKLGLLYLVKSEEKQQLALPKEKEKNKNKKAEIEEIDRKREKKRQIDNLLDIYNDYKTLYELFHDQEYYQVMRVVIRKLQTIVNDDGKSHV